MLLARLLASGIGLAVAVISWNLDSLRSFPGTRRGSIRAQERRGREGAPQEGGTSIPVDGTALTRCRPVGTGQQQSEIDREPIHQADALDRAARVRMARLCDGGPRRRRGARSPRARTHGGYSRLF